MAAVIEATGDLLKRGERLSMNAVARRAGVGIASVYDYFAKKEGLLGALVDQLTERNFERLTDKLHSFEEQPLELTVEAMLQEVVDTHLEHPKFMVAVVESIFRLGLERKVLEFRDRFADVLSERVHREFSALSEEDVRRAMRLLCNLSMGVLEAEVLRGAPDRDRVTRELGEVVEDLFARLRRKNEAAMNTSPRPGSGEPRTSASPDP